ncbi:hypothetical protein BDZ89DRAFT_1058459 [Hymenopellis radicata]|nr:hypothetical protein BDZ89DRAFT_1058459 [Hymenopellis radicata]
MAKLPPSIKRLLTLRNPNPLPSPSAARVRQVLSSTYQDAKFRNAETGWLVLSTCTLLTLNRPPTFGHLYRFLAETDEASGTRGAALQDTVNKVALIREAALKSTIFVGVPRVILSLAALNDVLDEDVKSELRTSSRRVATSENIESTVVRGKALWDSIYAPHADKLHDKLGGYHPDFITFIIQAYGAVLAPLPGGLKAFNDTSTITDPDQGNLSRALGSVVGIACLRAEERVVPQLTSHVFGLLKARDVENQSIEDAWLSGDEGTEWVIRTIDTIVDGVTAEDATQEKSKL